MLLLINVYQKLGQCIYNVRVCSAPFTPRNIGGLKTLLFIHSSSVVDGNFIDNIKVEFTSNFNEMCTEFAEPWPPYFIFREGYFSR